MPQVIAATGRTYQDPQRCLSTQQLWEALPSWGATAVRGPGEGMFVIESVKAQPRDKLVSQAQLSVIVSRRELADCGLKLWVKSQMEHARRGTQDQQVSAPSGTEMEMEMST